LQFSPFMIRFLITALGVPVLPAFLALLSWMSPSAAHTVRLVWLSPRPAVWEIEAKQNAETEALKARIEVLQERVAAVNQRLATTLAQLESTPR
jgi:uncharacterized protein YceH (UPF0502 family)